jgi:hypothetical protein
MHALSRVYTRINICAYNNANDNDNMHLRFNSKRINELYVCMYICCAYIYIYVELNNAN